MEDLSVLGNAAAVPIVITITQMLKRNLKVKYGSDIMALIVSLFLCFGWELHVMDEAAFYVLAESSALIKFRWGITQMIVGFATWLSASKLYDLGYGEKKLKKKIEEEKEQIVKVHVEEAEKLKEEVVKLKKSGNGGEDEPIEEDPEVSSKLLEILKER